MDEDEINRRAEDAAQRLSKHMAEREAYKRHLKEEGVDFNSFLRQPKRQWKDGELEFYLVRNEWGSWCGYVRFPKRPVQAEGHKGLLTYVPVHGGITWAEDSPDGSMVYGFDCGHASDHLLDRNPEQYAADFEERMKKFDQTKDPKWLMPRVKPRTFRWLKQQCYIMAAGIRAAARYEQAYIEAGDDRQARANVIDNFHRYLRAEALGDFDLGDNFGAMLALLSGQL